MMIKKYVLLASIFLIGPVGPMGCGGNKLALTAQDAGEGPGTPGDQKPDPTDPKAVELFQPLILQKPTLDPSEFSNIMKIEFGDADQAWFSFTYSSTKSGSLFFVKTFTRLTLECSQSKDRVLRGDVFWQERTDSGNRVLLKRSGGDITEFEFVAGKKYILSYVVGDLKKDLPDCKGATLRFSMSP